MVAVFFKNLLSWYLIMKLKQSVRPRRIEYLEIPTDAGPSQYPSDQQQDHLVKQQQQLPDSLIKGKEIMEEAKAKSPESNWVIYIRENLKQARQEDRADAWGKLCIYRVPKSLRECDNMAYIPQIVSVGPYHHGKKGLRDMERHKWRALYHILKRTHQNVQLYLDSIKELEEKAVACYEGQIGLNSNEFILMMVLDGCFILELFRGATEGFNQLGYSRNDPVFCNSRIDALNSTRHVNAREPTPTFRA
ncbi:hypothetical protein Vadar_004177 [Vaccinium darrowii]|uniref:Uncharacterized protein n=1 Tax=Vaccinium darrowii TaxID=229202 RepID=A0ACB7YD04_9ERIC|nr:hypothetical protein Vadar_004177 [Vaccinium darrowii]